MPENEKFLDILPPHRIDTQGLKIIKPRKRKRFLRNKKTILLFIGLILIFGAGLFYFKNQKIEIKIWPTTQTIEIEREITLKEGVLPNFAFLILPVVILETETQDTQKFPASYVAQEKKAEGIIRVYNAHSTAPLSLIAQTRFLSEEGKLFRTPQRIIIPGKELKDGRWIPGQLNVRVVAAEPGENYNIGPSKFSLPALAGTNLFILVYGKSQEKMVGGFSGQGHQVLAADIETAENVLAAKIEKVNIETLKQKASEQGQVLLEETAFHQTLESSSSEEAGAVVEEFEFTARVRTRAFSLNKQELQGLSKELVNIQMPENKMFWEESLVIDWQFKEGDIGEGRAVLSLKISAKISDKIEKAALLDTLAGQSISEAILLLRDRFEGAEILIPPFWLGGIPKNIERIEIDFVLDPVRE